MMPDFRSKDRTAFQPQPTFALGTVGVPARNSAILFLLSCNLLAWFALATLSPVTEITELCITITSQWSGLELTSQSQLPLIHAFLMVTAMMLPLAFPYKSLGSSKRDLEHSNSLIWLFPALFITIWVVIAMLIEIMLSYSVFDQLRFEMILMIGLFAAAWQTTPIRQKAIANCRHILFETFGQNSVAFTPTVLQCTRYTLNCFKSCLPIMTLSAISGHALLPMALLSILLWNERETAPRFQLLNTLVLIVLTLVTAALSLRA